MTDALYAAIPEENPPGGLAVARDTLAGHLGLSPNEVAITCGGSCAVFTTMLDALQAEDQPSVLLPDPWYPQYVSVARQLGAAMQTYAVDWDHGIDIDDIVQQLQTNRPTLAIINTPHNPTGTEIEFADLVRIIEAAASSRTRLILDETFAGVGRSMKPSLPPFVCDGLVHIAALGKVYPSLADARVGYMATTPQHLNRLALLHRTIAGGASTAGQLQLANTLSNHPEREVDQVRRLVQSNKKIAEAVFREHPRLAFQPQPAGIFARLMLLDSTPAVQWSRAIRDTAGFWCNPAATHTNRTNAWLRLRLAVDEAVFRERVQAIARLDRVTVG